MSGAPGIGATRGALAPVANAPVARSWRRGFTSVTGRLAGFNHAPKHPTRPRVDARARSLGFGHALVSGAAGASRRLGVVTRARKDDKLRDELNATRRALEQVVERALVELHDERNRAVDHAHANQPAHVRAAHRRKGDRLKLGL